MQLLYGMIFVSFMTFGLLVSYIALLFWVLSMFPILRDGTAWRYSAREYLLRKVNGIYFMCAASLVHFFQTPLYVHHISKDQIFNDEEILMICNHRTRVDIIFAGWCYASLFRSFPFLSVILKDDLKKIPLFGWCMQIIMYIFLSRNKAADLPHLKKMLEYAKSTSRNTNYFLFPEGTDLSETRKSESHACKTHFILKSIRSHAILDSKAKGLKELNYVMYPKAAAFSTCLESLRAGTHTVVHDLTVAYRDYQQGERPSEKAILLGHFPKEIHLFVRKYQISDIPESEAEAKEVITIMAYIFSLIVMSCSG